MSLLTVQRLELKNFMTHRAEQVDFPKQGTVLLWGPSGAGKSSLLDAVGFACFGLAATRASSLQELRHELYPEEDFGVRLTLALGDQQVQIFRGLEDSKTVVWMVESDGEVTEGPRAVNEKVSELLGGMDSATFFATYYSQQGELDALVKMAGGGRRKFVQRMLGITLLDKVSTQINRELLKASERISTLDDALPEQSKADISQQAIAAEKLSQNLSSQIIALEAELEAIKIAGQQSAQQLEENEKLFQQSAELAPLIKALSETTLPSLQAELERLIQQIMKSEQAEKRLQESHDQQQKISEMEKEAEKLASAEGQLGLVDQLAKKLTEAQQELQAIGSSEKVEVISDQLHQLHSQQAIDQSRIGQLKEHSSELEGAGSCPLCLQDIADPLQLKEKLKAEMESLTEQEGPQQQALAELLERLRKAEDALAASSRAQLAEIAWQEALQGASGADAIRLKELRSKLQLLSERKAQIGADRTAAQQLEELLSSQTSAKETFGKAQSELEEARQSLATSNYDPEKHQQIKEATEQARQHYLEMRDQLAGLSEVRSAASAELQAARAILQHYDATVSDRKKAELRHGLLKRLDVSMKDFKSQLASQIIPALQAAASGHLSALTEGKMSGLLISEDYGIEIVGPSGPRQLSLCSGGEQARVAFALRLSLTQLVSTRTDTPVGFMVFDEIFGSQDEGHRRAILESLRYLRGLYPQILLISHDSDLRESDLIDTIVDVPDSDSIGRIQVQAR